MGGSVRRWFDLMVNRCYRTPKCHELPKFPDEIIRPFCGRNNVKVVSSLRLGTQFPNFCSFGKVAGENLLTRRPTPDFPRYATVFSHATGASNTEVRPQRHQFAHPSTQTMSMLPEHASHSHRLRAATQDSTSCFLPLADLTCLGGG